MRELGGREEGREEGREGGMVSKRGRREEGWVERGWVELCWRFRRGNIDD